MDTIPTLRAGIAYSGVMDWLFSLEHVQLRYGLKYNGLELEKLSPGTKGIVLLMLYMWIDQADVRL